RAMRIHQVAIGGPEFFDRKVRAKQAALGAEQCDRGIENFGDMRAVGAMNERAKSRKLGDDVRTLREFFHTGAPGGAALRRKVFQHTRMLEDERYVRTGFGKSGSVRHLWREHLQVKLPVIVGDPRDVA